MSGDCIDVAAGERGDAAEALQEVQGDAFAFEQAFGAGPQTVASTASPRQCGRRWRARALTSAPPRSS